MLIDLRASCSNVVLNLSKISHASSGKRVYFCNVLSNFLISSNTGFKAYANEGIANFSVMVTKIAGLELGFFSHLALKYLMYAGHIAQNTELALFRYARKRTSNSSGIAWYLIPISTHVIFRLVIHSSLIWKYERIATKKRTRSSRRGTSTRNVSPTKDRRWFQHQVSCTTPFSPAYAIFFCAFRRSFGSLLRYFASPSLKLSTMRGRNFVLNEIPIGKYLLER